MVAYLPAGRTVRKIKVPLSPTRWVSRSTGTRDPNTVRKMQAMVRELGRRGARAWDLLAKLETRAWSLMELYERYVAAGGDVDTMRAALTDVGLVDLREPFLAAVEARSTADTAAHYALALASLEAAGITHASHLTVGRLGRWLTGLRGSAGTRRKYAAGVSAFCAWLVAEEVLAANPMRDVQKPAVGPSRVQFLDEPAMIGLVDAMPSPYRELSAFIHGTALDVSAAVAVEAGAIDLETWGFTHLRPKSKRRHTVLIANWARPYVAALLKGKLPRAPLGAGVDRWRLSKEHRAACAAKGITNYWLRDARHSWAVRFLKLGGSPAQGAEQLGHSDGGVLFLKTYAVYVPSLAERQAVEDEGLRRQRAREGS